MGISLPFETGLNKYVSPDLGFMFHYFFTRKFWMVFHAQALVCCPGGMGTCDELFELLTLKQTGKLPTDLPVVLLGVEFWSTIVNWKVRPVLFSCRCSTDVYRSFLSLLRACHCEHWCNTAVYYSSSCTLQIIRFLLYIYRGVLVCCLLVRRDTVFLSYSSN
jgi:hypothetical protein